MDSLFVLGARAGVRKLAKTHQRPFLSYRGALPLHFGLLIRARVLAELGHSSFQIRPLGNAEVNGDDGPPTHIRIVPFAPARHHPKTASARPPAPSWGRFFALGGGELG
jgi:hypothetical protein